MRGGEYKFSYADINDPANEQMARRLGTDESKVPVFAVFHPGGGFDMRKFVMKGRFTAKAMMDHVNKVIGGKAERTTFSEGVPRDWDKKPVKVLVGRNFKEVAFDPNKKVVFFCKNIFVYNMQKKKILPIFSLCLNLL